MIGSKKTKMTRRDLLLNAATMASLAGLSSIGIAVPPPPSAPFKLFLFVPMGSLPGNWSPDPCTGLAGKLLEPFAPLAESCIVPQGISNPSNGFGLLPHMLCDEPYKEDAFSLDAAIARFEEREHLMLYAKDALPIVGNLTPTVFNGSPVTIDQYLSNPNTLAESLMAHDESLEEEINEALLRSDDDSEFSWNAKAFLKLSRLSFRSLHSTTITLMLGDDDARISAPGHLGLPDLSLRELTPNGKKTEFITFKHYIHSLIADFLLSLKETVIPDVGNMLDGTIVYLFTNMGDADHYGKGETPILLAGGSSTFNTGVVPRIATTYDFLNTISVPYDGYVTDHYVPNLLRHYR